MASPVLAANTLIGRFFAQEVVMEYFQDFLRELYPELYNTSLPIDHEGNIVYDESMAYEKEERDMLLDLVLVEFTSFFKDELDKGDSKNLREYINARLPTKFGGEASIHDEKELYKIIRRRALLVQF